MLAICTCDASTDGAYGGAELESEFRCRFAWVPAPYAAIEVAFENVADGVHLGFPCEFGTPGWTTWSGRFHDKGNCSEIDFLRLRTAVPFEDVLAEKAAIFRWVMLARPLILTIVGQALNAVCASAQ